jgi:hypothetical protein
VLEIGPFVLVRWSASGLDELSVLIEFEDWRRDPVFHVGGDEAKTVDEPHVIASIDRNVDRRCQNPIIRKLWPRAIALESWDPLGLRW